MRILRFIVDGQRLEKDLSCDFTGLVAGARGYLRAKFRFSAEWTRCKKIAVFTGCDAQVAVPLIGNECEVPAEAITGSGWLVKVVGQRDGYRIPTNHVEVKQITG